MSLTNKQKAFIEEYFKDFNATRAAARAGYSGTDATLAAIGSENLTKPKIAKRISERLSAKVMTADEVLERLSEQSRNDISNFIRADNEGVGINWDFVKEKGHLIKSITPMRYGWKLELYDAQAALQLIGKHHRLFTDRVEHSGDVKVKGYVTFDPDQWDSDDDGDSDV